MIEILSIDGVPFGPATESSRDLPALTEYFQDRQAALAPVPGRGDTTTHELLKQMAEDVAACRRLLERIDRDLDAAAGRAPRAEWSPGPLLERITAAGEVKDG